MSERPKLLFLHIPKTAGTSFKWSIGKVLGQRRCVYDYGTCSADTSSLIRKHVYQRADLHALTLDPVWRRMRFLCGHFHYGKYGPLFDALQVLSFCRDPREQLMSHYAHLVRHYDYADGLESFLRGRGGGLQGRVLGKIPLAAMGFVGVTERYEDSMRVFHHAFGLDLDVVNRNQNPDKPPGQAYVVPEEVGRAYEQAVGRDMPTWTAANRLLDTRLAALEGGYSYVHGDLLKVGGKLVQGFAFESVSDVAVDVELWLNGCRFRKQKAAYDCPALRHVNAPRHGYVGYDFRLEQALREGDKVEVCVAATGQCVGRQTIV